MRLFLSRLLVLAIITPVLAAAAQAALASPAWACDIVSTQQISLDDLRSTDLTLEATDQVFTIEGAYLVETMLTLEATDDWTRGSVNAIDRTWGEQPASTNPFVHRTVERASDDCPPHGDGPALGDREIRLVTEPETNAGWVTFAYDSEEEAFAALKEEFGLPHGINADPDEEARLLRTLHNARPGSAIPVAVAFGIGLVVFGSVSYWRRHRQLVEQWNIIKADADAELPPERPRI